MTTDRKIRVLWLVKGLGPGGAETLLVSLARVADGELFEYHAAYVLPWKDQLVPRLEAEGVTTHCLGGRPSLPRWAGVLRKLLLDGCFDVVHVHSPLVAGVLRLVVRTLPRTARPAVISTEHNTWSSFAAPTRVLNAALFRTDRLRYAVSREVRESIPERSREGVQVLVHGLVLDDAVASRSRRADVRAALGYDTDAVVIGTVANYRAQKGYPDLLRAARLVIDATPRAHFLAVGQGPLQAAIEEQHAELALSPHFRLLGHRTDVMDVLSACDVFVLASHHEGFPIALMEALAMGLPAVATSVGGVPDAVEEGRNGLLVPPGRPHLLAAALLKMVEEDDFRKECAVRALETGQDFDIRNAAGTLERAYRDSAGRPGA